MKLNEFILQAINQQRATLKRKYKIKKLKRLTYPTALSIAYAAELKKPINFLTELIERYAIGNAAGVASSASFTRQHDAYDKTLEDIIVYIQKEFSGRWSGEELKRMARATGLKLSETNRRQLTKILSNAIGVPIFFRDGWEAAEIGVFANSNASLITSLATQHITDVQNLITTSIRSGRTVKSITKEIETKYADELINKPRNRAELIARDQVGKFYSDVNQLRQRELGVDKYIWRGVLDERERQTHRDNEGKIFSWDNPPSETGHPGEEIQCRCIAEPYLEGISF